MTSLIACLLYRIARAPFVTWITSGSRIIHAILLHMSKNVTIYSADWCAYCHAAKDYLNKKGIAFTEKDVESDVAFAQEAVEKSNQMGIPVLDIDGTIIVGFDRPKIDAALGL